VAVSLREATYTHGNIMERKAFTVNVPSEDHSREADYIGTASGRNVDKFAVTGLTPVRSEIVDAPYVAEFPLVLECRLLRTVEIGLHTQFIGEIVDVKAEDSILTEDGAPDIWKIRPIIYSPGNREYGSTGERLGTAFKIGEKFSA